MSDKPSEAEKRRDAILKRMLHMPPKHKGAKPKPTEKPKKRKPSS